MEFLSFKEEMLHPGERKTYVYLSKYHKIIIGMFSFKSRTLCTPCSNCSEPIDGQYYMKKCNRMNGHSENYHCKLETISKIIEQSQFFHKCPYCSKKYVSKKPLGYRLLISLQLKKW